MLAENTRSGLRTSSGIFGIFYLHAVLAMFMYVVNTINLDNTFQKKQLVLRKFQLRNA
jgi:hypothetical protein